MNPGGRYALVADDDEDWRQLAASTLRRAGLKVWEAANGQELLSQFSRLRAHGTSPAVVVSDIQMPGATGIEAAAALRGAAPRLPILLLTGLQDHVTRSCARDAGATLVLTKPVAPDELRRTVQGLLERQAGARKESA
jgi:CheY-like chemotaxis protein